MNDNKFIILSSVFFLIFIFGITTLLVQDPLSNYLRATNANISSTNSIITANPQVCSLSNASPYGCPDKNIKINVFVRSDTGDLLADRSVQLTTKSRVDSSSHTYTQTTDKTGKSSFTLTSSRVDKLDLSAEVKMPDSTQKSIGQQPPLSVEFVP